MLRTNEQTDCLSNVLPTPTDRVCVCMCGMLLNAKRLMRNYVVFMQGGTISREQQAMVTAESTRARDLTVNCLLDGRLVRHCRLPGQCAGNIHPSEDPNHSSSSSNSSMSTNNSVNWRDVCTCFEFDTRLTFTHYSFSLFSVC